MKSFAFAALAAIGTAAVTEGPTTDFPTATFGSVTVNGGINETQIIDEASGESTLYLNTIWTNEMSGGNFPNGALVQNYAQWSSMTDAGKYMGVICSVTYDKSNGTGTSVSIVNINDSESLAVADKKFEGKTWSEIGTKAEDVWFEKETDPAKTGEYYGRTYQKNKSSSQNCGTSAMLHYQENGEDVDGLERINEVYWLLKNAGDITLWSGFRIWENSTDRNTYAEGDAAQVSWSAHDWGLEDPNGGVIVPDEEDMESEAGAAAIMAAATALTAILMF